MMHFEYFDSIADVKTWYVNSGYVDWEWFDGFDPDDLIEYIFRHSSAEQCVEVILIQYLREHGENPDDYDIDLDYCED